MQIGLYFCPIWLWFKCLTCPFFSGLLLILWAFTVFGGSYPSSWRHKCFHVPTPNVSSLLLNLLHSLFKMNLFWRDNGNSVSKQEEQGNGLEMIFGLFFFQFHSSNICIYSVDTFVNMQFFASWESCYAQNKITILQFNK